MIPSILLQPLQKMSLAISSRKGKKYFSVVTATEVKKKKKKTQNEFETKQKVINDECVATHMYVYCIYIPVNDKICPASCNQNHNCLCAIPSEFFLNKFASFSLMLMCVCTMQELTRWYSA